MCSTVGGTGAIVAIANAYRNCRLRRSRATLRRNASYTLFSAGSWSCRCPQM